VVVGVVNGADVVDRGGGRHPSLPAGALFDSATTTNRRSYALASDMAISISCGFSSSTSIFNGSSNPAV
jgi:hypothetical protein